MNSPELQEFESELQQLNNKPVSEHSLGDMLNFFNLAPGLTSIFSAESPLEWTRNWNAINIEVGMAIAATQDSGFDIFEYPTDSFDRIDPTADGFRTLIEREIELRVRELRKRKDTSFVLLWNFASQFKVHCAKSKDLGLEEAKDRLIDRITHDVKAELRHRSGMAGFDTESTFMDP